MGSDQDFDHDHMKFRRILLAAIVSLIGVVILIFLLHFYARYLMRRQERRWLAALNSQRGTDQIAPIDIDQSYIGDDEPPKSGLDPLVIASLPMFTYKLTYINDDDDEPTECSVCLGTILEESTVRLLPNCKHFFHVECIDTWLGSQTTCPICRTVAEPTFKPEEDKEMESCSARSVEPTAPPAVEENVPYGSAQVGKEGGASGSGSRFGSFRRILGRDRSSSRIQNCGDIEVGTQDLER